MLVCFRQAREALPGEVAAKQRIEKHCDNLRRVETSLQIKGGGRWEEGLLPSLTT